MNTDEMLDALKHANEKNTFTVFSTLWPFCQQALSWSLATGQSPPAASAPCVVLSSHKNPGAPFFRFYIPLHNSKIEQNLMVFGLHQLSGQFHSQCQYYITSVNYLRIGLLVILFITDALFSHIPSKHNYSLLYIRKEKFSWILWLMALKNTQSSCTLI